MSQPNMVSVPVDLLQATVTYLRTPSAQELVMAWNNFFSQPLPTPTVQEETPKAE